MITVLWDFYFISKFILNMSATLEKINNWAKRRGFIFPASDIYGGLANVYDYGPYGIELKRNVQNLWWQKFVQAEAGVMGMESQILMHPEVWVASGHVDSFTDPLVEDKVNKKRYRADHLIEDWAERKGEEIDVDGMSLEDMDKFIEDNAILSPDGNELTNSRDFNLLFETSIGAISDQKNTAYLRAETAQGMFVSFKDVMNAMSPKLPFGLAQVGKAFRNEITKGKFIFRTLEFEQMEIQYFIKEEDWESTFEEWRKKIESWYFDTLGIAQEKMKWKPHHPDDMAHYAKKAEDLEYKFDWGFDEVSGLHYRTDFDLNTHAQHAGKDLTYRDPYTHEVFTPHDIESTWGLNRNLLMLMYDAYEEEELEDGKIRTVMKFDPKLAPVKAAVFPLQKDEKLQKQAQEIFEQLRYKFNVEFSNSGNIGKMYRKQDEIGTPYCITVDYDTLGDSTVTVRDRDTMQQERIKIDQLNTYLLEKVT